MERAQNTSLGSVYATPNKRLQDTLEANARHPGTPADACTITGSSVAHREQLLLENTSRCLAEARSCLETLVSSAEPPGELLPSSTFALKRTKKIEDGPQTADGEGEGRDGAKSGSGKAKLSAKAQDKGAKGKSSTSSECGVVAGRIVFS